MSGLVTQLPASRADLVIRPLDKAGRYVVKDPSRRDYFELGEEERLLLLQLDGNKTADDVCDAFQKRFGEPLSTDDLNGFIEMARRQGLLQKADNENSDAELIPCDTMSQSELKAIAAAGHSKSKQSLLFWRKNVFDPDRFFSWLEPKIRFFWTRAYLVISAGCIVLATLVLWTQRQDVASSFAHALRWETALIAWLTMLAVGTLHEFGHGLTCKHHGGEVHEIGFLLLFFMPGLYCNVSDAWLFREKSKRMWVTLAGGYFELFLWALAVFVWRLTVPGSLVNYLAFVVLSVSGIKSFFNFNPLIKLDGYYLLSDWLEIPNLRQRSFGYMKGLLRWLLWGAQRPNRAARGKVLLGFGVASWVYSVMFLSLMVYAMSRFVGGRVGPLGFAVVGLLGVVVMRGMFQGFSGGEAKAMILRRHKRTAVWALVLGSLAAVLGFVDIDDRASGPCEIRSATRAEVCAPVAGFLQEVYCGEGDQVSPGAPVVRLEIPDLESRLAQKRAEIHEAVAQLRLLEIGTRPEELEEQRQSVKRAEAWRDLARHDLARLQQAFSEELDRLNQQVAEYRAELAAAKDEYTREVTLSAQKAAAVRVCQARLEKGEAERRARQATETWEAEAELARREKDLADARSALTLLEAGSRPEEVEAARAELDRLQEELRYLEGLEKKLPVYSLVSGLVTTPRMQDKVGHYLQEGDLICTVEEPVNLEIAIALPEEAVERVEVDQPVRVKARGCPYDTFETHVDRIAPAVAETAADSPQDISEDASKTVTVYCRLNAETARLRPGMTGYARITTGRRPIGAILVDRTLRFLRTEFWW